MVRLKGKVMLATTKITTEIEARSQEEHSQTEMGGMNQRTLTGWKTMVKEKLNDIESINTIINHKRLRLLLNSWQCSLELSSISPRFALSRP